MLNICAKIKTLVMDVLYSKHPDPKFSEMVKFHLYATTLALVDLVITYDIVKWVAKLIQGVSGQGGG